MKPRHFFFVLCLVAVFVISRATAADIPEDTPADSSWPKPLVIHDDTYRGRSAQAWHRLWLLERRRLRKVIAHHPTVSEAIHLAGVVYGNSTTLWRRARCESHLWPYAHNSSGASGLFQFMPGTWRSTPFRGFSIWSPYANALAAGWMMGPARRGSEWSCR